MFRKITKVITLILALALICSAVSICVVSAEEAAPAGDASFLTLPIDFTDAEAKNTHSGLMGFTFTAKANITITALGRPDVIGGAAMTRDHELAIWQVQWNENRTEKTMPVQLGKVTVSPTSPESNGYRYGNLETPVKIVAGREYIITSAEYYGVDNWLNGYKVTGKFDTSIIDEIDPVYSADYNGDNIGMQNPGGRGAGEAHDALNFWYVETTEDEEEPGTAEGVPPTGDGSFLKTPVDLTGADMRNSHNGLLGFTFKAKANINVTALGRPDVVAGKPISRDHELAIWQVEWNENRTEKNMPVLLGKVTVNASSPEYNGYRYENLETPVRLTEGYDYIITSAEYMGSDAWVNRYPVSGQYDTDIVGDIDPVYSATFNGDQIGMQDPGTYGTDVIHNILNFWYVEAGDEPAPTTNGTISDSDSTTKRGTTTTANGGTSASPGSSGGANPWIIVGILVGCVVLAAAVFFIIRGVAGKGEKGTNKTDDPTDSTTDDHNT